MFYSSWPLWSNASQGPRHLPKAALASPPQIGPTCNLRNRSPARFNITPAPPMDVSSDMPKSGGCMDDKRPSHTPRKVQDPSRVYERCRPEDECGQGRLENNSGTPTDTPDRIDQAVKNRQPNRQINAD